LAAIMDDLLLRAVLLLAILVLAGAFELIRRRRSGRAREVDGGDVLTAQDLASDDGLGERATFVQFSSPACSPCRAVRRVLTGVVADDSGLAHLEIDATEHLDLTRRLNILRTPTVLLLDPRGRVVRRISGVPTAEQARAAVQSLATSLSSPSASPS
jgi:thiol-disulfide isomerase/thioredoxin